MIPTLYEEYETEYISNGIGRLSDAISCVITQNKSGTYELVMQYPLDGIHAEEITNNRIIYAVPERGKNPQPFRIRNVEKTLNGKMNVIARHNCYDLNYYACKEFGQTDVVPYQITPSLYDSHDELIGVLNDLIMYTVDVGTIKWTLTMLYPANGTYVSNLITSNFIYAQPVIGRDLVMFDITSVVAPTTAGGNYTVTAKANIVPYVPTQYNQMTVIQALGYVKSYADEIQECPFTFTADPTTSGDSWITTQKGFWSEIPKPVKPLLQGSEGSVVDVFGGEWEFDHFNCILHEQRGSDNGVQYRYGKNITSINERINIDEIYTHAFSFWKGTASSSTNTEQGEYYTKMGTILNILDSDFSAMFPTQRTLIIDASDDFEYEPTAQQLDDFTRKYVADNSSGTPTVTIEVSIVDLANTKEYEDIAALEEVNLYDTVTIVFPRFGINVKSKVTEIEYDVLKEKNNHVIIGNVTTKLANIIAKNKSDIVKTKADLKKWADKAMERATEALAGWNGGNIRKNYNKSDHKQQSMYIMNTDNMQSADKAIKFDGYGIGISGNGAEGNYYYMVNMSGDGLFFTDEFAEDGDTNASFLKRGIIKSSNDNYWDIENDEVKLKLKQLKVTETSEFDGAVTIDDDTTITGTLLIGSGSDQINVNEALSDQGDSISSHGNTLENHERRITAIERRLGITS